LYKGNYFVTFELMKAKELIKVLEAKGWYQIRQSGSHRIFTHDEIKKTLSIPDHGSKDLGKGLVNRIMKDAGVK
jgi:predicted RNA binding protein YcfA (HicA-like mRNA interferase family)